MKKVICNRIGSTHLCEGCGAAIPHYNTSCEPCPVNEHAQCIEVFEDDYDDDEDSFEPCDNCDLPDACAVFGCAIRQGLCTEDDYFPL